MLPLMGMCMLGSQLWEMSLLSCLDPWGRRACPSCCAPLPPSTLSLLMPCVFRAAQTLLIHLCHLLPGPLVCMVSCSGVLCPRIRNLCSSFSCLKTLPTLLSVPKLLKFSLPWVLPAFGKGGLSGLQVTDTSSSSCTCVIVFRCQKHTIGLPP